MPDILDSKERKARKSHTCSYCGGEIKAGEVYDWEKLVFEGELYEWKAHKKCTFIASKLWKYIDPDYDGMTEEDFRCGAYNFCADFVCPECADCDAKSGTCEFEQGICIDKIYDFLQTHDLRRKLGKWWEWECYLKNQESDIRRNRNDR